MRIAAFILVAFAALSCSMKSQPDYGNFAGLWIENHLSNEDLMKNDVYHGMLRITGELELLEEWPDLDKKTWQATKLGKIKLKNRNLGHLIVSPEDLENAKKIGRDHEGIAALESGSIELRLSPKSELVLIVETKDDENGQGKIKRQQTHLRRLSDQTYSELKAKLARTP